MASEFEYSLQTLIAGDLLAWPTDTTWGLLARADLPEAVERVYHLKHRPPEKPLQLLAADHESARRLVDDGDWAKKFKRLAAAFWPGGLTIVAPASTLAPTTCVREGKVGLRVPADPELRRLLAALGGYVAATSLNRSGEPPVLSYRDAMRYADWVGRIHPGEPKGRRASTVVDLVSGEILRTGAVPAEKVLAILEDT